MADHDAAAIQAVTALQFNAPWDPWGLTPDEARTVIDAAMPHIRAQIAGDLAIHINDKHTPQWNNAMECAVEVARGES